MVELDPILGNVYRAPNPRKELEKAKLSPIYYQHLNLEKELEKAQLTHIYYQNIIDNLGFDLVV